jgi:hypothetical protein
MPPTGIDVSHAHGLTHLRNALLEDQSFDWCDNTLSPMLKEEDSLDHHSLPWTLSFYDPATNKELTIHFSKDCRSASKSAEMKRISTEPIANGLREIFAEFSAEPASNAAN